VGLIILKINNAFQGSLLKSAISQMQIVRNSVKENQLSSSDVVTDKDYEIYLTDNGKEIKFQMTFDNWQDL